LLIGVNRSLLRKQDLYDQFNSSKYFSRFGFFFNDAPSASKISPLLDKWINL